MTENRRPAKKIIWPVSPYKEDSELNSRTIDLIRTLSSKWQTEVHPVAVMSPANFNILPDFWPDWETQFRDRIQSEIRDSVHHQFGSEQNAAEAGLRPARVLTSSSPLTRDAVRTLLRYAKHENADLVLAPTHARTGVSRLFLGSFAETLLLEADLPVLAMNPSSEAPASIHRILHASDLEAGSTAEFHRLIEEARALQASLVLFHKFHRLQVPGELAVPGSYGTFEAGLMDERRATASRWAEDARKHGVETDVVFDTSDTSLADAVQAEVERSGSQMIALFPGKGAMGALLLGSSSRQIVRSASVPVWLLRNKD